MEWFLVLAGASGAWFFFSFRATKERTQRLAAIEFVQFLAALQHWEQDEEDPVRQMQALRHYEVFNRRFSDFLSDPTGRSLPAERAVLAANFVIHMRDMGFVGPDGYPSHIGGNAAVFWMAVFKLRELNEGLGHGSTHVEAFEELAAPEATVQDRERDRAKLVQVMRQHDSAQALP